MPSLWLSPERPRFAIVLTILRNLRIQLERLARERPGAAVRNRLSRAEGKQAQDNEVVDDEDTITIIDDEDTITIIDD